MSEPPPLPPPPGGPPPAGSPGQRQPPPTPAKRAKPPPPPRPIVDDGPPNSPPPDATFTANAAAPAANAAAPAANAALVAAAPAANAALVAAAPAANARALAAPDERELPLPLKMFEREEEEYNELIKNTEYVLHRLFTSLIPTAKIKLGLLLAVIPNESSNKIRIRNMIKLWNTISVRPATIRNYAIIIQFVLRRVINFIPDDLDPEDAPDAIGVYAKHAAVLGLADLALPFRPIKPLGEAKRIKALGYMAARNAAAAATAATRRRARNRGLAAPVPNMNNNAGMIVPPSSEFASAALARRNVRNTRRLQNNHRPFGNQGENRGKVVGLPTNRQDFSHKPLGRNRHAPGSYANLVLPAFLGSHLPPFWKSRLARRTQNAPRANMVRLASPNSGAALATNMRNTRRLQNNRRPQLTGNYRPSLLSTLAGRLQQPQAPNRSGNLMRLRGLRTNDFAQAQVLGMGPVQKEVARLARRTQNAPPPVNRAVGAMENAAMHNNNLEYENLGERLEVLKDELNILVDFLSKPDITEEDRGISIERLRVVEAEYTRLRTILLQNQHQSPEEVRQRAALANAGTEAGRLGAEGAPERPDNGPNDDPPPANQGGGQRGTRHRKAGRSPRRAPAPQQPRNNRYVPPPPRNISRKKLNHPPGKLGLMQRLLLGASLLAPGVGGPMKVRWRPNDTPGPPLLPPHPMGKQVAVIPGEGVRDGGVEAVGRLIPGWGPYNGLGAVEERRRAGPLVVIPGQGPQGIFTGSYPGYGELTGPFKMQGMRPSNEPSSIYPGEAFLLHPGSPPLRHVPMGKQVAVLPGESVRNHGVGPVIPRRWGPYNGLGAVGEIGPGVWQGPMEEGVWQGPMEEGVWQGPMEEGVWQGPLGPPLPPPPPPAPLPAAPSPPPPPPPPPPPGPHNTHVEVIDGKPHLIHRIVWGKTPYDIDVVIEKDMTGKQLMDAVDAAVAKKVAFYNWPAWKLRAVNKGVKIGNVKIMRNNLKVLNRV